MTKLKWDQVGERRYETGVDHGVLYLPTAGVYDAGYAWNGLTTVTESPSGAESNKQYADNIVYLNLISAEEFGATVEAFTYPKQFAECDGTAVPVAGVSVGQQPRRNFGLSYRTQVGNDTEGSDFGYKLHLVYGAQAAPSEKAYATMNDSPEAITFSWELTTTPVEVGEFGGKEYKPTSVLTLDSTEVDAAALASLEQILYGTEATDPRLPLPAEVFALFEGTVTEVETQAPTESGGVITIPSVTGVEYMIGGEVVTGTYTMTDDTVVTARPASGYVFSANSDDDWVFYMA